jgi:hypothetical protein
VNRRWEDVKREAAEIRGTRGWELSQEARAAIRKQMLAEIRAFHLAETRRRQSHT